MRRFVPAIAVAALAMSFLSSGPAVGNPPKKYEVVVLYTQSPGALSTCLVKAGARYKRETEEGLGGSEVIKKGPLYSTRHVAELALTVVPHCFGNIGHFVETDE